MNNSVKRFTGFFAACCAIVLSAACTANATKDNVSPAPVAGTEIYEVHHEGRIHVFYDRKSYEDFLSLGETPFRLTRIGAGPNGETIVFGLTRQDKKQPEKVDVISIYDGIKPAPVEIYAEMRRNGRVYVFNDFDDMKPVRQFGHPNLFYTEIGAGPNGETVVYVLNEGNKKKRPDALIAKYKSMNM